MRLTRAEKKKFLLQNPKNQLITKTDLAKVRNTWDGFPHIVSRGAQTNFIDFAEKTTKEWNKGEVDKFSDKYFQETVALLLIYKYMEKMIPNQTWYLQGYRANIITYTIAFMRMLIKKQFNNKDLDLISIWSRQAVPNTVQQTLIDLSEKVYFKITDSTRSVENVTQWCKREECWNSVKNISYILPDSIENFLTANDKAFI